MEIRAAADADRDAVLSLGVAEEAAWFGEAEIGAEEVGEWVDEEGGVARGVVMEEGGRIVGFASAGERSAVFLADPAQTVPIADALLPWLRERREALELMTYAGDAERVAAFERHGLRHQRSSFTLARPQSAGALPEAGLPEGVEVAPYAMGDDDEAVHRLQYVDAAWAAVPGHTERDLEAWRTQMGTLSAIFVARREGRPVGLVAGRVLESGRGYVQTLAVARDERGRGLGRALLLHAFADLQRAGAGDLTLGVEADNAGALGLYRSVGLEIEREWRTYAA